VQYERKDIDKCRSLYVSLLEAHPSLLWAKCRVAWLDSIGFIKARTHSPLFSANGTYLSPEEPEEVMFKAIKSKTTILAAAENSVQQTATQRLFAVETCDIVVNYETAIARQCESDKSHQSDKQIYEVLQPHVAFLRLD